MSRPQRYFDPSQPQTLQIGVFLLYFDAAFLVLRGGAFNILGLLLIAGYAGSAYGIANGKKVAYQAGVGMAILGLVFLIGGNSLNLVVRYATIDLMFAVALVALLLHPQSRQYTRIWFS